MNGKFRVFNNEGLYTGTISINISGHEEILTDLNQNTRIPVSVLPASFDKANLSPNMCCYLVAPAIDKSVLAIYKHEDGVLVRVKKPKLSSSEENAKIYNDTLPPLNYRQAFAHALLIDKTIDFVTLVGPAGTSKTIRALAAGFCQRDDYDQILVISPTVILNGTREHGFYPGSLLKKMLPWAGSVLDNLERVLISTGLSKVFGPNDGRKRMSISIEDRLFNEGRIDIQPLAHLRGRSLHGKFLLVEDAQNLTIEQVQAVLTRVADYSKVVFTGDLSQIDDVKDRDGERLTRETSGLALVVNAFKGDEYYGHLAFEEEDIVRGRLARTAVSRLKRYFK